MGRIKDLLTLLEEKGYTMADLKLLVETLEIARENDSCIDSSKDSPQLSLDQKVSIILGSIGMPNDLLGYSYFKRAIILYYTNTLHFIGVPSSLYRLIAEEFNSTPSRVERSMRYAIYVVFNNGNHELLHELFRFIFNSKKSKPTISQFIVTVTDYLKEVY